MKKKRNLFSILPMINGLYKNYRFDVKEGDLLSLHSQEDNFYQRGSITAIFDGNKFNMDNFSPEYWSDLDYFTYLFDCQGLKYV